MKLQCCHAGISDPTVGPALTALWPCHLSSRMKHISHRPRLVSIFCKHLLPRLLLRLWFSIRGRKLINPCKGICLANGFLYTFPHRCVNVSAQEIFCFLTPAGRNHVASLNESSPVIVSWRWRHQRCQMSRCNALCWHLHWIRTITGRMRLVPHVRAFRFPATSLWCSPSRSSGIQFRGGSCKNWNPLCVFGVWSAR